MKKINRRTKVLILTIILAVVLIGVYLLVFLVTLGLSALAVKYLGNFGVKTIKPLLWGFNFLLGTLFAIWIKKIIAQLKKKKLMKLSDIENIFEIKSKKILKTL